jgi:hypothetical protein
LNLIFVIYQQEDNPSLESSYGVNTPYGADGWQGPSTGWRNQPEPRITRVFEPQRNKKGTYGTYRTNEETAGDAAPSASGAILPAFRRSQTAATEDGRAAARPYRLAPGPPSPAASRLSNLLPSNRNHTYANLFAPNQAFQRNKIPSLDQTKNHRIIGQLCKITP